VKRLLSIFLLVICLCPVAAYAKPKEKVYKNTATEVFQAALRTAREKHVVTYVDEKNLMFTFETGTSALSYGFIANASIEQQPDETSKLIINVQKKNSGKNASISFNAGDRMADKFFAQVGEELARKPTQKVADKPDAAHIEAPPQAQPTSLNELTGKRSATFEISSMPQDADIELDGSFAGNTPSSVGVEAGEHIIKISKNGFNPWERKIKSSTGTVRVSANLDPIRVATSVPASSAVIQQENGTAKSAEVGRASIPATTNSSSASAPDGNQPRVNGQALKVEEARSGTAPAKNNVVDFLGASSDEKKGERHDGVRIDGITLGGPADNAGLKLGDYILAIDNHYLFTVEELDSEVSSHKLGTRVAVRYRRYSTIDETFLIIGGVASTK
jgi:PEGA domain/PDZ domain